MTRSSKPFRRSAAVVLVAVLLWFPVTALAHETRPAYLELRETTPERYDVLWRTPLYEGLRLPFDLRFPDVVRNITEPRLVDLPDWHLETWRVEAGGGLAGRKILFRGHDATTAGVVVRLVLLDGTDRSVVVPPTRDGLVLGNGGSGEGGFGGYVLLGIRHIAFGLDHLLFILGLLCIVSSRLMLIETITAFTLAHSLTLAAATLGLVTVPVEPVNAAVGLSILFLGPEIVRHWRGDTSLTIRKPWLVAFAFGLLHGLGFAGSLSGLGLPRRDLILALVGFNVGVEIGQLGFVLLVLLVLASLSRLDLRLPRWLELLPGYVVGSAGAWFAISRTAVLLGM